MGDDMITEGMLDMFIFETEQGLENLENICLKVRMLESLTRTM